MLFFNRIPNDKGVNSIYTPGDKQNVLIVNEPGRKSCLPNSANRSDGLTGKPCKEYFRNYRNIKKGVGRPAVEYYFTVPAGTDFLRGQTSVV
jgi:hypothetical protein